MSLSTNTPWIKDKTEFVTLQCIGPPGSYGHKGFTGILLWIALISNIYLIVLTNRVCLSEKNNHETLRAQVFFMVVEATGRSATWAKPAEMAQRAFFPLGIKEP